MSGWLQFPFPQLGGRETMGWMGQRGRDTLGSPFASRCKSWVTLEQMLTKHAVPDYRAVGTGEKHLVTRRS